jgi:hypothetical protein
MALLIRPAWPLYLVHGSFYRSLKAVAFLAKIRAFGQGELLSRILSIVPYPTKPTKPVIEYQPYE